MVCAAYFCTELANGELYFTYQSKKLEITMEDLFKKFVYTGVGLVASSVEKFQKLMHCRTFLPSILSVLNSIYGDRKY